MFEKIEIQNFQSHKDTKIELSDGINVITGQSDSGKTAIMRAIDWAFNNNLRGEYFCSNWIKNEKGVLSGETFVNIDGVKRYKDKKENGYFFAGEDYKAIKTEIPEKIQSFFNIEGVNIQRQLDKAFLVSETSGQVAKYFNKLVNLDSIDKGLGYITKKRKGLVTDIKYLQSEINENTKKIDSLAWVFKIEKKVEKYSIQQKKIEKLKIEKLKLGKLIEKIEKNKKTCDKCKRIENVNGKVSCLGDIVTEKDKEYDYTKKLQKAINGQIKWQKQVNKKGDVLEKIDFGLLKKIMIGFQYLLNESDKIEKIIVKQKENFKRIAKMDKELILLQKQIPELCPLCGSKIKKGGQNV